MPMTKRRAKIIFLAWSIIVFGWFSLFSPYGSNLTDSEIFSLLKILVIPPSALVALWFLAQKFVSAESDTRKSEEPSQRTKGRESEDIRASVSNEITNKIKKEGRFFSYKGILYDSYEEAIEEACGEETLTR